MGFNQKSRAAEPLWVLVKYYETCSLLLLLELEVHSVADEKERCM